MGRFALTEKYRLTDGSYVYNVLLHDDAGLLIARLCCVDEESAHQLAKMIEYNCVGITNLS